MSESESDLLPSGDEEQLNRNVTAGRGGGSSEDNYSSSSSSGNTFNLSVANSNSIAPSRFFLSVNFTFK
jgi:hypothetical protein